MTVFNLHLNSNESNFDYIFPYEMQNKKYEIALVKLQGYIIQRKSDKNNNMINNIFLKCNFIKDTYVNNKKINSICRFNPEKNIYIEPYNLIYHKINTPNTINIQLVDITNSLIIFEKVNLFVELFMKEID